MLLSTLFLFIEQPKTIIFIVLILVLFFGAKRIPEMMRGIGQGVREFKDAASDLNKAPQTNQPYNPNQPAQPPYGQQAYPAASQPGYPAQQPYATQPGQPYPTPPQQYPTQPGQPYAAQPQAPVSYDLSQPSQVAPATHDANGQPLS